MGRDAHNRDYQPVSLEEALEILRPHCHNNHLLRPSDAAYLLWPGKRFCSAQGAARAAAGVLAALRKRGYASWACQGQSNWGWRVYGTIRKGSL